MYHEVVKYYKRQSSPDMRIIILNMLDNLNTTKSSTKNTVSSKINISKELELIADKGISRKITFKD